MILRRVIEHVKAQNWFAVFLDFVIVVAGVFVGIQVSNWNASRADRGRAEGYLERIAADLDADLGDYADRLAYWAAVSDYAATGLSYAESRNLGGGAPWPVLLAYFQASQVAEFITSSPTWDEMLGAGDLRLIENIELRSTLARYYKFGENPALSERPAYRENVRELIPFMIQRYIWENCYASTPEGRQAFIDCAAPVDAAAAQVVIDRIAADEELMGELRYWYSTMVVASRIGRDRVAAASDTKEAVLIEIESMR